MAGAAPNRMISEDWGPDSGGRQKNIQVSKPFLLGCRSRKFPVPVPSPAVQPTPAGGAVANPPSHSHEWTVYLRPFENEDFSPWIKKVQFKLHDSYPNQIRTISAPPYEVKETGWGEFEVAVKVFFVDPNERQMSLYTWVRLFKKETEHNVLVTKEGYSIFELYDEFVFTEPTMLMLEKLNLRNKLSGFTKPEIDYEKQKKDLIHRIRNGRQRVTPEIQRISNQYENFKTAYGDLMNILRGDPQSRNISTDSPYTAAGSEYGGSVAAASQSSSQEQYMD